MMVPAKGQPLLRLDVPVIEVAQRLPWKSTALGHTWTSCLRSRPDQWLALPPSGARAAAIAMSTKPASDQVSTQLFSGHLTYTRQRRHLPLNGTPIQWSKTT